MSRFAPAITAAVIIILLVSCGPPKQIDLDESKRCRPHSLSLSSTASRFAKIAWDPGCPGIRVLWGFNIYVSPEPLAEKYPGAEMPSSVTPFNAEVYPGDEEGKIDRETFDIEGIENATRYYVHVRAIYSDYSLSSPTNEIEIVCYPRGEIELGVSYTGSQSGFSFTENDYCATDALENDIYFYHKDGKDYLCSPSRLGAVNRETKIYTAGRGESLGDVSKLVPSGQSAEKVEVISGGIYILETEEGYPVKLRLKKASGSGDNRKIILEYIYKPPVRSAA